VSEELENSLQQAIESYLGKRLAAIDEQLSRLQSDFDEALKRVRESSSSESPEASSLSATIFAHLQSARAQKLSGATEDQGQASGAISNLKRAVESIEGQQKHADILGALLTAAAEFAERAAIFVIRNGQAIGWRECEAGDPTNLEMIGGVSLPLSADTLLGRAAQSHSTWTGAPGSNSEDSLLIDQLGGHPRTAAAMPLVVRGKVVAVLYADSVSNEANALNVDALELLARVAAMVVNLASAPRAVPEKEPEAVAPAAQAEPEKPAMPEAPIATAPAYEPEPAYTPEVETEFSVKEAPAEAEAEAPEEIVEPSVEQISAAAEAEVVPEEITEPPDADAFVSEEPDSSPAVQAEPVQPAFSSPEETTAKAQITNEVPQPAPPVIETPPPAPSFASQYAAPLGGARRYGVSEPDLPIEVGEDERRLHNDARRFARLLVSEIKLYNEPKVKEGRSRSDIYDRLREDIDRSRQMYDKRVAPPVAARHDYFHQELVNTLAEGDSAKLGASYPGAILAAN
jgi:hypothetical protein